MDIWSVKKIAEELVSHDITDGREAQNIGALIWTEIFHFQKSSEYALDASQSKQLAEIIQRLNKGEPIQYIVGHSWFYGIQFKVSKDVLVPRPETEELVEWILEDWKNTHREIRILDIGTGSGCIPVILKKYLKSKAHITAIDISTEAINIASYNAEHQNLEIQFVHRDFIKTGFSGLGVFDVIVSNPPYIHKESVDENILKQLQFEPPVALYPIGDDPDIFYKKILQEGIPFLQPSGAIYLELNEFRADHIRQIAIDAGWTDISLKKDMQGMNRMLRVSHNLTGA